jgi:hypothetical protein
MAANHPYRSRGQAVYGTFNMSDRSMIRGWHTHRSTLPNNIHWLTLQEVLHSSFELNATRFFVQVTST